MESKNDSKFYPVVYHEHFRRKVLVEAKSKEEAQRRVLEMLRYDSCFDSFYEEEYWFDVQAEVTEKQFKSLQEYGEIEEYEGENGEKWKRRIQ